MERNQPTDKKTGRKVPLRNYLAAPALAGALLTGAIVIERNIGNETPSAETAAVAPGEIVNKNLKPRVEEFARALNSNVGVSVGALAPNDENSEGYDQIAMLAMAADGREVIVNFLARPEDRNAAPGSWNPRSIAEGRGPAPGSWKPGTIKEFDAKVVQPGVNEQVQIEVSAEFTPGNGSLTGILDNDVFTSLPQTGSGESATEAANNAVATANDALGKMLTFVGGKLVAPGGDI